MPQRIYLTNVTVAKQYNWSLVYNETCTKAICKSTVAR